MLILSESRLVHTRAVSPSTTPVKHPRRPLQTGPRPTYPNPVGLTSAANAVFSSRAEDTSAVQYQTTSVLPRRPATSQVNTRVPVLHLRTQPPAHLEPNVSYRCTDCCACTAARRPAPRCGFRAASLSLCTEHYYHRLFAYTDERKTLAWYVCLSLCAVLHCPVLSCPVPFSDTIPTRPNPSLHSQPMSLDTNALIPVALRVAVT